MRAKIKQVIESTDTTAGRWFDIVLQVLIVLAVIAFSIETLPDLTPNQAYALRIFENTIVILFSIEYLARIYIADRKTNFVFSFYGIVDLVAILPFYLAIGLDLSSIRVFRLFRVLRLLKLARYNVALRRFRIAFHIVKEEVILFSVFTAILLYVSAIGIYYFERDAQPEQFASVFHSLWWAVTTLTTVGYGDVYPVTLGGKVFTFITLMIGLGVIAVPTGLLASALSKAREMEDEQEKSKSHARSNASEP